MGGEERKKKLLHDIADKSCIVLLAVSAMADDRALAPELRAVAQDALTASRSLTEAVDELRVLLLT